jgi:hypothetical protein
MSQVSTGEHTVASMGALHMAAALVMLWQRYLELLREPDEYE